jgi:Flp pilus assembly protein CpaB
LLAAVLVVVFLQSQQDDTAAETVAPTLAVVVAKQDIPSGTEVTAEMVEVRRLPEDALSGGYVGSTADVVGKTTRYPLNNGEQVTQSRLVEPLQVQALSFQIPQGLRGMTIPVSISETPAALIAPGDFVDVIMLIEAKFLVGPFGRELLDPTPIASLGLEDEELRGAYTLMQNIQVLTVDRGYVDDGVVYDESVRGQPPEEGANVGFVTLAVTPEQAQALFLAQQEATLTIVLRPFGDDEEIELRPFLEPFVIE